MQRSRRSFLADTGLGLGAASVALALDAREAHPEPRTGGVPQAIDSKTPRGTVLHVDVEGLPGIGKRVIRAVLGGAGPGEGPRVRTEATILEARVDGSGSSLLGWFESCEKGRREPRDVSVELRDSAGGLVAGYRLPDSVPVRYHPPGAAGTEIVESIEVRPSRVELVAGDAPPDPTQIAAWIDTGDSIPIALDVLQVVGGAVTGRAEEPTRRCPSQLRVEPLGLEVAVGSTGAAELARVLYDRQGGAKGPGMSGSLAYFDKAKNPVLTVNFFDASIISYEPGHDVDAQAGGIALTETLHFEVSRIELA